MRILFIVPYVPNSLRTRPYFFLKNLALRHHITVVTPTFNKAEEQDALRLGQELNGLEVITVPLARPRVIQNSLSAMLHGLSMQAHYCYSPDLIATVQQLVETDHYDLAHVEHFRMGYIGPELKKLGLPVVYDAVDCISLLVERTLKQGPLKNRLVSFLELNPTRRYDRFLLNSGSFKATCATSREDAEALEDLSSLAPGTIEVIPNGVDINYFRPGYSQPEPDTVVFSGKMSYHANAAAARYLVKKVWPYVKKLRPQARLFLVGSRPPKDLLALSGQHGIEVTGYVPQVRDYLQRASVAVAPMLYSVGIQNKVLEAMACSIPVVASPGITRAIDAIDGRDICLESLDHPEMIAYRLARLLENPEKAAEIGANGRAFVSKYHTWEKSAEQLEQLWLQVTTSQAADALSSVRY